VRIAADTYQAQEVQELTLAVAGSIEINPRLRPLSDVWESGQTRSVFLPGSKAIVNFFGPDVDTSRSAFVEVPRAAKSALESTVSEVIDPIQVRDLPLAGRDVYTMVVTQPGVTADTTTARGLGVSVNGQRPSSSNFLLDGVENNNYLVTGPLTAIAPEAVQEYRISTNNFSAEYGRTAGFVANALTRSGGARWHGIGYLDFKNTALDANGFQENLAGLGRQPVHEAEFGYDAGGPIRRSLFVSSAFDRLRTRDRSDPQDYLLPSALVLELAPATGAAHKLLTTYPSPIKTDQDYAGKVTMAQPVSIDRSLALERVDYSPAASYRLLGRVALTRVGRPDFIWSPYPDFISPLADNAASVMAGVVAALRPSLTNEARLAWSSDDLHWDRAHPEIPTLVTQLNGAPVTLPGSPAMYPYLNRARSWELVDNITWVHGRHVAKAGAGGLWRGISGALTAGRDGFYAFQDPVALAFDQPFQFAAGTLRGGPLQTPDYQRDYRYHQLYFFLQDAFRASPRLTLNYGVRYEHFGAPVNTGSVKDAAVQLGTGATFPQRLAGASLLLPPAGDQQLFQPDNRDWGVRLGAAYNLAGNARTVLRGAYGIFYDRPFDNLWQTLRNNNVAVDYFSLPRNYVANFLAPVSTALTTYQNFPHPSQFPNLSLFQSDLKNGYVQSWFAGASHQLTESWTIEVTGLGALGRRLITTDLVNRPGPDNNFRGYNPTLGLVAWRSGQGLSDYAALTAVARYRGRRAQFQAAYTWSHSIDNQSDPLLGEFFSDLSFARATATSARSTLASFARQFDSRGDRGNSDFDQRQNLVFYSIWDLPGRGVLQGWKLSQLAAFRTGFPYTVLATALEPPSINVFNNRANLINPQYAEQQDVKGGRLLLNAQVFSGPSGLGNTGRNAFRGPGLYNIDVSLARSFRVKEALTMTIRADAFNVLNHANLNNPQSNLGVAGFGVAQFGRTDRNAGFPSLAPLNETARQIQMIFRVEF
jgi:hypothetical protein